ncbi:hypothetical protein [Nocardia sp. alder85J]|uniref:hypothetical protein n=1 Tax=Nocardia sp. alder85J TaxID=2862949 RepID=UPI001CD2747F|nr:hypothetical protein [Nocardia sp. alder85J]MCX4094345.1 hypothetical protein [Nocardia sp. alder85J]
MITPIEIKVNVGGDVTAALTRLRGTDGPATSRRIWFAEARFGGTGRPLALLSSHIIIRLRSGDHDDLTVKLRPCQRSQLAGLWAAPFTEGALAYRLVGDWSGRRRMLSAAVVSSRAAGSLREVATTPGADIAGALDSAQRRFLVSCTPPGAAVDHLVALGPIESTRWSRLRLGDVQLEVERWCADSFDMLELTARIEPREGESLASVETRAAAMHSRLESAVRRQGMQIENGFTKTHQVITALAARVPQS